MYFLLQNFGSYGEWRARGFILLGDVYLGMEDPFQAKATWQSVIDHHKGENLVLVAQQKLDALIQLEKEESSVEEEEIELDYNKDEKQIIESPVDSLTIESAVDSALIEKIEVIQTDSIKLEDE